MSRPVDPNKKPDNTKPSVINNSAEKLTDRAVAGDEEAKRSLIERKKEKDINKKDYMEKFEESLRRLKSALDKSGYDGYKPSDNQQRKASRTGETVEGAGPNKGQRAYSGNPARPATYKQVENEQKKMRAHARTQEGKGKSLKDSDPEKYAKLKAEIEARNKK
jgi:hypothetical protein